MTCEFLKLPKQKLDLRYTGNWIQNCHPQKGVLATLIEADEDYAQHYIKFKVQCEHEAPPQSLYSALTSSSSLALRRLYIEEEKAYFKRKHKTLQKRQNPSSTSDRNHQNRLWKFRKRTRNKIPK